MADEAVLLGPGGPRNLMKITQSRARIHKRLERRGRVCIGKAEAVKLSDPERACLSE